MGNPLHHISKRKRAYKKLPTYPHPKTLIRWFDNFLLIIAVLGPLIAIPQIVKIYTLKTAAGLSLITFSFMALGAIFWVTYGIIHKDKPIIISYFLWFAANIIIIIGILIYS